MDTKKVEFMPPKDVAMPEGTQPGDDWDLVCTFRTTPSGVCLVKMGDAEMPGYDGKVDDDKKPSYSAYADSLRADDNQMSNGGV